MNKQNILDINMRMKLHWWQKTNTDGTSSLHASVSCKYLQILEHLQISFNKDVSVSQQLYNAEKNGRKMNIFIFILDKL